MVSDIPDEFTDLINKMLDDEPKKRPTCKEVLNHPYLKNGHKEMDLKDNDFKDLFKRKNEINKHI